MAIGRVPRGAGRYAERTVRSLDRLVLVRPDECRGDTPQTSGMRRLAAISGATVGAEGIWMGRTHVPSGTASGAHHHGRSETAIFVLAGRPVFIYRDGVREVRLESAPGDFVYVPPFVPHIESNLESDEEAVVIIARTTQEAIVENLPSLEGEPTR
ncbi:MAG: cupin domain-containing protein [Candidatus Dormibacteraceae bacterium]